MIDKPESFRKLSEQEMINLGINFNNQEFTGLTNLVKKYFGENAYSYTVLFNSDYDDNYHQNTIGAVVVYDGDGKEVTPEKKYNPNKVRREMIEISFYKETEEPLEDITIFLKKPELYIKEN